MPEKKLEIYMVECDKCRRTFSTGDREFDIFTEEDAKSGLVKKILEEHGWFVIGKKTYCEKCKKEIPEYLKKRKE